jgi:hypothetical protein
MVKKNYNIKKNSSSGNLSRFRKSLGGGRRNMMCLPHKDILMEKLWGLFYFRPNGDGAIYNCRYEEESNRPNNAYNDAKDRCEFDNTVNDKLEDQCFWSNTNDPKFDDLRTLITPGYTEEETPEEYKIFFKSNKDGEGGDGEGEAEGEDDDAEIDVDKLIAGEGDDEMTFGGGGRLRRKSRRKRKGQRKSRRSKRGRSRRNPRRNRRSRRR